MNTARVVAGSKVCTGCDKRVASYRGQCFDCNAKAPQVCAKCGIDHAEMAWDAVHPRLEEAMELTRKSFDFRGEARRAVLKHAAEMARQAACRIDMGLEDGV